MGETCIPNNPQRVVTLWISTLRTVLEKLQQQPLWRQLKAVQKNQVYIVDAAHWYGFDVLAMNAVIDDLFKYLVVP